VEVAVSQDVRQVRVRDDRAPHGNEIEVASFEHPHQGVEAGNAEARIKLLSLKGWNNASSEPTREASTSSDRKVED